MSPYLIVSTSSYDERRCSRFDSAASRVDWVSVVTQFTRWHRRFDQKNTCDYAWMQIRITGLLPWFVTLMIQQLVSERRNDRSRPGCCSGRRYLPFRDDVDIAEIRSSFIHRRRHIQPLEPPVHAHVHVYILAVLNFYTNVKDERLYLTIGFREEAPTTSVSIALFETYSTMAFAMSMSSKSTSVHFICTTTTTTTKANLPVRSFAQH